MNQYKKCLKCNKKFYKQLTHSKKYWGTRKFCSSKCNMLGKKNKLGKTGYKHTEEAKIKIGFASKGEKNAAWKGGITPLRRKIRNCFKYRQWRSDIYTRDNFTCVLCDRKGLYLNADHIKSFSKILEEYKILSLDDAYSCEELWNINNGRTLCVECHKKTDNFAGKGQKRENYIKKNPEINI